MKNKYLSVFVALALLALLASAATASGPGVTTRVSVASDGTQGNGESSNPTISRDGRTVAFESYASTLVTGDTNGMPDVFIHDNVTGATTRVSVASDGTQANFGSFGSALSSDGHSVAFYSQANNLVTGDTNAKFDVFVRDLLAGTTERVSVASDGTQGNNPSWHPAISADGSYVVFDSDATNLVTPDTNAKRDVFLRDRAHSATFRISVGVGGTQTDGDSSNPVISANGGKIAFSSSATNLVNGDTNGFTDVFVYDRSTQAITRVSVATDGSQANGTSLSPAISSDGRYVAFESAASNLVAGDTNGKSDIFIHDNVTGATTRVSVASDGTPGNNDSYVPRFSGDQHAVAFMSLADNLVAGDTNSVADVFVRNLVTNTTTRVSVAWDGAQGNNGSSYPALSSDGSVIAFQSNATNLVAGDSNAKQDIFVRKVSRAHSQPDFNADGLADLLWRHAVSGQNAVWLMNGASPLSMALTSPADTAWTLVGVGDLDGDTRSDLVWRHSATGQNAVWFMNGATVTSYAFLPTVADLAWTLVGVGDLNADTKADLVWRHAPSGQNVAWLMDGATIVDYGFLPNVTDSAWKLVGIGDLDADGRADLVWRHTPSGQNVAWLMNGGAVAGYAFLPTVADVRWTLVGVGDLSADYAADLVWRHTITGQNIVWLMDGGNVTAYAWLPTVEDQDWKLVAVSDLDGDLTADLVWRHFGTGQTSAWLMNGGTVRSYNWLDTVADLNWRVVSPTSLMAALNGLLPGPTKQEAPEANTAKPMWSATPKDLQPFWSAPEAGGGR